MCRHVRKGEQSVTEKKSLQPLREQMYSTEEIRKIIRGYPKVRSAVKFYKDSPFRDGYCSWRIHDISEQLTRPGVSVTSHASGQTPVDPNGHHEQSHVEVDLEADGR
jgi:hypothetical protein